MRLLSLAPALLAVMAIESQAGPEPVTTIMNLRSTTFAFAFLASVRAAIAGPVEASKVRVQLNGPPRPLHMAEVEVFDLTGANVALNKPALQSSVYGNGNDALFASLSVDGEYGTFAHTNTEEGAWWEVDLGEDIYVKKVVIHNRRDCCQDRLSDSVVSLRDVGGNVLKAWAIAEGPANLIYSFSLEDSTSPTSSPTSGPTTTSSPSTEVPPPWAIAFLELNANFTALSYEDLKLKYEVGKGRDYETFLYQKDCESNITDITITSDKVRAPKNNTFDLLTLSYNVSKDEIMNSTIWNSTSGAIEICQVVNLIVPAANGMDKMVLVTDVVKTNITFDLVAEIELLADLGAGAVDNATETIDVADVVKACKCSGASFGCNSNALAPNDQLFTCVYSEDNSIQVDRLISMDMKQGEEELEVVGAEGAKIPGLTSVEYVPGDGVRVGTRVPVNKFNFADGESITISGAVDMKLPGLGRRLRSLADDGAAVDENEEAAFELRVALVEGSDLDGVSVTSSGRARGAGVVVSGAVAALAVFSVW